MKGERGCLWLKNQTARLGLQGLEWGGGTLTYIIDSLYSSVRFGLMLQKFWVVIQLVGMVGVQDPTI